jgi:hypothetical protein
MKYLDGRVDMKEAPNPLRRQAVVGDCYAT